MAIVYPAGIYIAHEWFRTASRVEQREWLREVGLLEPSETTTEKCRNRVRFYSAGFVILGMANWQIVDAWVEHLNRVEGITANRTRNEQQILSSPAKPGQETSHVE